ncbi:MAG TPA: hypothetical protein VK806_08710 [Bacteroidia bacterium]|jgi:hypothetical protein|nr:hypothetical protein [Bacteroidia bacterium]
MITLEKIKFYKEHYWNYQDTMNGYPNQLKGIEGILSNEDLSYFLRLISDMFYVKKDLASTEWIDRLNENLKKKLR